jgi:hypothetical protein
MAVDKGADVGGELFFTGRSRRSRGLAAAEGEALDLPLAYITMSPAADTCTDPTSMPARIAAFTARSMSAWQCGLLRSSGLLHGKFVNHAGAPAGMWAHA